MAEQYDSLFTTPAMAAIFAAEAHVGQLLRFEAALARAEAGAGIIPPEAPEAIAAACRVELYDVAGLYREAGVAGTLAIPLMRALTARVAGDAAKYVHWGATSQDAIDTALMLQMRDGLDLLIAELRGVCGACAALAEGHRATVMAGRTLLQQALPITFGLKAARWLSLALRQLRALRACRDQLLALQFGGAAGTLAALGEQGLQVAERLGAELGLAVPELPWHAERDRVAAIAGAVGVAAGSMGKLANDLVLLAQSEVGEVSEAAAPGKGGSSALPHKRNPVDATLARAAARLALGHVPVILQAMDQEHERAAGGWQAEWAALPALFCAAAAAASRVRGALEGLEVDAARMRANLDQGGGLLMAEALAMALAPQLGRPEAQRLAQAASKRALAAGGALHDVALADAKIRAALGPEAIAQALDPGGYLGSAGALIDRALQAWQAEQGAS